MKDKSIIVGLDVGTKKVCTIVGINDPKGNQEIIGVGTHPSYGLKKGSVVNIDKTIQSIHSSIEEARLMSGVNFEKATVGIAGSHIYSFNSTGIVAIKGKEIVQEDIDRVIEAAKAVVIPSDREILHVIPQEYRVDNFSGIKNPIGMCGVRLEARVHIVTGAVSSIQNLLKCVEQSGIKVEQIVLQPLASSQAVLTSEEREMGVVLVDIGGGTTDVVIWKNGSIVHSQIIPVGGNHFTNDLAVALKVPHTEAERVKINHGTVLRTKDSEATHITVQGIKGAKSREVPLLLVSNVLRDRANELIDLIKETIEHKVKSEEITGGVIITGGGALIKGFAELSEFLIEMPIRIGYPIPFNGMTNVMQNTKFSTVLGLLIESSKFNCHNNDESSSGTDVIKKLGESIKQAFKEIF